jgi:hypothetical protein
MVMKIGLLWYDDDPKRPWVQKVEDAARRYYEKFGVQPDTCYLNPATTAAGEAKHNRVRIVLASAVLPNHFWLGVSEG